MSLWREIVARRIATLHDSAADKRMDLAAAIRRFVRPGMKINPVTMQARPQAAMYELCRQFAGTRPGFEFVSSALSGSYLQLAHLGLLRKAVVSFAGEGYPTPGPSPVTRWALERGDFELENWTMLTISQRLLAGAMGVPFLTTRSLIGSSLAEERQTAGGYAELPDPFNPGQVQGVISAYQPDIAFVHVWAADRAGNAVCFPPYQENIYGALAARQGVVLTAHQLVSTEFIRRYSHLVRIPAEIVLSVSEVPYGSHPYGNYSAGIPELRAYANDYSFMKEHREAQGSRERYDAWIREWILDSADQDAYLAKVGDERLRALHRAAEPDAWQDELELHSESLDQVRRGGNVEEMIVQASREVAKRIVDNGYKTVLAGAGQASLMCWLAAHRLREEGVEFALLAETGMYGFDPRPGDPFLTSYRNLPTCTLLTDVFEALGLHGCGGVNACMGTIGAGEIDKYGNVNSTRTATGEFLVGSGGANDIVTSAAETVVVAAQRTQTFVEKVGYVTSPGAKIRCVISTMGRFEKLDGDELVLTGYLPAAGRDREQAIAQIRRRCGWELKVADQVEALLPASEEDLALLRLFDPERFFLGKPADK
ncbi:glutaconate CoA-transferase, subunit A [Steroidobacter denitrificans]|uniref:Glutaconate CoA-transferase, subunit A n=1 Tax=Steroidobacter denitrificans TaxID=465721 RepID=A0A127F771_STEDE|nr:CoA-transferase [Steroidobacter denitrificans]AMN46274.1 glutaconate CoA-transferase, subunit A [Steroidobacter denitrificans]